jgi:XTP/dITP diphosphohydrolase
MLITPPMPAAPPTLLVATTNPGKLREYRDMLAGLPVTWRSLLDIGLDHMDVEETGDTFAANALLKAHAYSAASGLPTLADDSGLMVDALGGAPGVYSARYAPTTQERNAKLLRALEGVPDDARTAHFACVTALVMPDGVVVYTEGRVEGRIGRHERGTNGFGYDPLFVLPHGQTMAELSADDKNSLSHRGRALAKLSPVLACLFAGGPNGSGAAHSGIS